ncbi:MAG TPA: hypothetical protein VFE23_00470 [Usitatibacter sp.]|jgi:hypothetical protein|nr:hypothetical protein [Usitatibacter sp.]
MIQHRRTKARPRHFGLFRAFALWVLLTYVCVYWLARDPCLARGGVLTAFVCGTDDGKVLSLLDLAGTSGVVISALIMGVAVGAAWTLARRLERASREES